MAELDVVQKEPRIGCIAGTKKRPLPHSVDVAKYSLIVVIVAIHLIPFLSLIPYIKPMLHMAVPFFLFRRYLSWLSCSQRVSFHPVCSI